MHRSWSGILTVEQLLCKNNHKILKMQDPRGRISAKVQFKNRRDGQTAKKISDSLESV